MNVTEQAKGTFIGLLDKEGNKVHIGDTLEFDPEEWYRGCSKPKAEWKVPVLNVVQLEHGEITLNGCPGDVAEYCRVYKRWDQA